MPNKRLSVYRKKERVLQPVGSVSCTKGIVDVDITKFSERRSECSYVLLTSLSLWK